MGLSDYVQLRARHPVQCDGDQLRAAMAAMPVGARRLAGAEVVSVVPFDHPSVPEEYAAKVRAGSGRNGVPSVTVRYDDGTVAVALGQASDLGHEMIHVAQVFASPEARARSFAMAAADGRLIAAAVARLVEGGGDPKPFSDLDWCAKAVRTATAHDRTRGPAAYGGSWDIHRQVHPKAGTAAVAASLGMDPQAAMAATFAAALADAGFADFGADVAREAVAYRFQRSPDALGFMFDEAAARAWVVPSPVPVHGRPTLTAARALLTSLPEATEEAVPLWVSAGEVDACLLAARGEPYDAYVAALRVALPAVRQPVDEDVPDGRFADGRMGAFHVHASFGGAEARRLWFGAEALAYRVVHLGDEGAATLSAMRRGSEDRREASPNVAGPGPWA